ncbi:hypothetical protein A5625_08160 [Mycobacterium sp. 1465703.0]|nr:hypothetical protein A5625_08160 [Mycobacterium sp. 1465703.0]
MPERFEEFHADNPVVYDTLVRLAREWVARTGRHKLGIATLFERTRWEIALATNDPEYKLNNNWKAYYARLIMRREPDLDELFDLRASEADEWIAGRAA